MKIFGRTLVCLPLLITFCSLTVAQDKVEDLDTWFIRATTITDDLDKDAIAVPRYERALLWARLSKVWWQDDKERARAWMQHAVEVVEVIPNQESNAERRERLAAARALLALLAQQDKKLGNRLTDLLLADAKDVRSQDRDEVASALIDAALLTLDSNPKRAVALGSAALQISSSPRIAALLSALYRRGDKLADELFTKALGVARTTYRRDLLASLAMVVFKRIPEPSVQHQRVLGILAEGLLRQPTTPNDQAAACNLAPIAATLLDEFQRLLPQQFVLIRSRINSCQPLLRAGDKQHVSESVGEQPVKTVDDLVKAADKAKDTSTRDFYLERAAYKASEERDFDRAISLLESMSTEGRKQTSGAWESLRSGWASDAALTRLKKKDYSGVRQLIDAAPANLRAFVQLNVVRALFTSGDRENAINYLNEARGNLAKVDATQLILGYLSLVRFYALLLPDDAPVILNEAITAMNRPEKLDSHGNGGLETVYDTLSNELLLKPYYLPLSLLERDPNGVYQAISSIQSPGRRALVRLNLLEAVLKKRRAVTPPVKQSGS